MRGPSSAFALERGRALFDSGRYFEAHEVWEEAWLVEAGTKRRLLQGLIQIAAALHKVSRGEHASGAVRLFDAGLAKLDDITDAEAGFPLAAFGRRVREYRDAARRWASGETGPPAPETRPRLEEE